jgi:hypothetical protein
MGNVARPQGVWASILPFLPLLIHPMSTPLNPRWPAITALLLFLMPALPGFAQTFQWAQPRPFVYSSNPDLVRTAASLHTAGGWWVGTEQKRDIYGGEALGPIRLTRLRADGTPQVQRIVEGNASALHLQALPDKGMLLVGEYKDSIVFDAQHKLHNPHFNSGLEYFLASLDSLGALRWVHSLRPGPGNRFVDVSDANAVVLDPHGTSAWLAYDTFGESYATRFDLTTGDSLTSIIQRDVERISSLALAPDGTVYVSGGCAETTGNYNGTAVPLPTGITYNTYVACYNANGAFQWVRHIEDITCPATWVGTADNDGVYFTGPLFGPFRFGQWQATATTFNQGAYFLTRLDRATGTFQWLRESPSVVFTGATELARFTPLATDAAGNAWLLTNTRGTTVWPGFGTITAPAGGAAALLAYDQQGNLRGVNVTANESSIAHTVAIDAVTGQGIVTGVSREGGIQLAPLPALPTVGATEILTFAAGFTPTLTPLGVPAPAAATAIGLAPNPVAAGQQIQLQAEGNGGVEIFDATGRCIARHYSATSNVLLMKAPEQAGLYLVRGRNAKGQLTGSTRLVVQ